MGQSCLLFNLRQPMVIKQKFLYQTFQKIMFRIEMCYNSKVAKQVVLKLQNSDKQSDSKPLSTTVKLKKNQDLKTDHFLRLYQRKVFFQFIQNIFFLIPSPTLINSQSHFLTIFPQHSYSHHVLSNKAAPTAIVNMTPTTPHMTLMTRGPHITSFYARTAIQDPWTLESYVQFNRDRSMSVFLR